LDETETAVNSEVKVPVIRLARVPESSVRPEVEPVVGADGGALVEELHPDAERRSDKSDILKVVEKENVWQNILNIEHYLVTTYLRMRDIIMGPLLSLNFLLGFLN